MLRSLVTGGAGFIGSHLVDRLVELNHNVTVLDNLSTGRKSNLNKSIDKISFINEDLNSNLEKLINFDNIDFIFHLAALADIVPSIQEPDKYFKANVQGTFNLLNVIKSKEIKKFIYAASSSCYGIPPSFPTNEEAPIIPEYPYALTKNLGEQLVQHWANVFNLPSISLRFFNVYGLRSRTSGTYGAVFGVFLSQKLAKKPFTVVGDGTQTRDFTHVSDVVNAITETAFSEKKNKIYNVGSENTISVNKIVDLLGGSKVFIPKRPGEPQTTFADITKIKKDIGWKPLINIENGVCELIENIHLWKDAPVWTPESIKVETKDWFKYLK